MLVILLDDVGFGASSTFGGPCETPVADRLASEGLRYNRFHTTALCAPTRMALLCGRNHHSLPDGPFRGVPILFKDIGCTVAGEPTAFGLGRYGTFRGR